jgi:hypothetical protein
METTKGKEPFCAFCDFCGHWAHDCMITDITERTEAKENKPVFPLPEQGAYCFKLQKEGKDKVCYVQEVASNIYL